MVHTLKMSLEEENTKGFLILNEIIITLKEGKEEGRKVAYDVLLKISASLKDSSAVSDEPHHKLISMVMGYLSGSSPHIKSGAVSALSVLVYKDVDIYLSMPDLVPSLLSLLHTKAAEVIKAVLGFVKVLVSCLQAKDLHRILSDVIYEVLPWSSVSRHHFRSKVTVIVEIMIWKCGSAVVESVTPEKYKGFLKTVFENRHSKTTKESGADDTEMMLADSSSKASGSMPEKRKRKAMGSIPKENDFVEQSKRKREKKNNAGTPSSNDHHSSYGSGGHGLRSVQSTKHSLNAKSMKGQSEGRWKKSKSDHNKVMTNREKKKTRKKDEAIHTPSASKLGKHKVGSKRQKINK